MHDFQHWIQMEIFYNVLNEHIRMVVNVSANGALLDKSYNEAYEILELIANNYYQYPTTRLGNGIRATGEMDLDAITSLTTQVYFLTNMIKTMQTPVAAKDVKITETICVYC